MTVSNECKQWWQSKIVEIDYAGKDFSYSKEIEIFKREIYSKIFLTDLMTPLNVGKVKDNFRQEAEAVKYKDWKH